MPAVRRLYLTLVVVAACTEPADKLPDAPIDAIDVDAPVVDAAIDGAMPDAELPVPDTTIDTGPADLDNSTTATFTFSADVAPATFECSIDGGANAACTSPHDVPGLADGAHTFTVTASNAAGVPDPTPAVWTWTIDSSTPDTQIDSGPGGATGAVVNTTSATFAFSSPDAGPGATFECQLDGSGFAGCTSPTSFATLAEAAHTFAVRVRDSAGNADPTPATWTWTVDVTPPNTTIVSHPADPTNDPVSAFTFTASEAATFECRVDSAAFAACTSPFSTTLAAGSHTFRVRATDTAGNPDPSPATFTWTIDLTPPDTILAGGPPDPTNTTTASFTVSATEAGSTIACRIDGGAFTDCSGGTASYAGLAAGAHTVQAQATDPAGNPDPTPASSTWTIDLTPPSVTTVTSTTTDGTYSTGAVIDVRVTFTEPVTVTGSPTITLETGAVDRTATFAGGGGTATIRFTYTVQAGDTSADLDYTAATALAGALADAAGNAATLTLPAPGAAGSLGANKAIVIDTTAPTVTTVTSSTANGSYGLGAVITIQIVMSEVVTVAGGTPTLTLETGAVNRTASYTGGSGSTTLAFSYTVTAGDASPDLDYTTTAAFAAGGAAIQDGAGNTAVRTLPSPGAAGSLGANKNLVIDGIAPVVTITSPIDGSSVGPHVTYSWTVDDGSPARCSFDGGTYASCTSPITTNLPAGPHTLSVCASDPVSNVGCGNSAFTVVCGPPTGPVPPGVALFHMEEAGGQALINALGGTNAVLGTDNTVEPEDPIRTTAGRFGSALDFDQVSRDTVHWLTGIAAPITLHDHTVEMWANMSDPISAGGGWLFRSGDGRLILGYRHNAAGQMVVFYQLMDDAGLPHTLASAPMAFDVFRHLVATYTGTTMTLWVDGVAVQLTGVSFTSNINLGTVEWGSLNNHIDGVVDEVYVANGALSATEVLDRYCPL